MSGWPSIVTVTLSPGSGVPPKVTVADACRVDEPPLSVGPLTVARIAPLAMAASVIELPATEKLTAVTRRVSLAAVPAPTST